MVPPFIKIGKSQGWFQGLPGGDSYGKVQEESRLKWQNILQSIPDTVNDKLWAPNPKETLITIDFKQTLSDLGLCFYNHEMGRIMLPHISLAEIFMSRLLNIIP